MSVSVLTIQRLVCEHFGIGMHELLSDRMQQEVVVPRHIAMVLVREHTSHSFPAIARLFKKKDHTTVLNAAKRIGDLIERKDKAVIAALDDLNSQLADAKKIETVARLSAELAELKGEPVPNLQSVFASDAERLELVAAKQVAKLAQKDCHANVISRLGWLNPESPFCKAVAAVAKAEVDYENAPDGQMAGARIRLDEATATLTSEWRKYQALIAEERRKAT